MDFHELEAFLALADTLHFARAAAQVHLSPSALSRLLSRLEEEVGVPLFAREHRQVSLTPEGETFLAFARDSVHRGTTCGSVSANATTNSGESSGSTRP
jgi:LysR family positive regulator for ilvC